MEHYIYDIYNRKSPKSYERILQTVVILVHCKAGLDSPGSLIGCHIMEHYIVYIYNRKSPNAYEKILQTVVILVHCKEDLCRPGSLISCHIMGALKYGV